jgi:hypothetical protein
MLETIYRLFARFRPDVFNYPLFLDSDRSIQLEEIEEQHSIIAPANVSLLCSIYKS